PGSSPNYVGPCRGCLPREIRTRRARPFRYHPGHGAGRYLVHKSGLFEVPPPRRVALGLVLVDGGAGGNRTRVRKSSTTSSTCLVDQFGSRCRLSRSTGRPASSHLGFSSAP